jgi:hypothetical protein
LFNGGGTMAKIRLGKELFSDLHRFFNMEKNILESKKSRLFPSGNTMDENQTTSIFLASLQAVKEYREELLINIGVSKIKNRNIKLHVYTEVYNEAKTERIDGLIVLTSGKNNPVIGFNEKNGCLKTPPKYGILVRNKGLFTDDCKKLLKVVQNANKRVS